ncbi:MAG: HlyD family efflux transporter periplasmic adaptor subunit [Alteromonadaceae bacterium]|nr:HlyD family efflux transporter periplasmic adaptor subunit [Alteromonadaceae bacterium]
MDVIKKKSNQGKLSNQMKITLALISVVIVLAFFARQSLSSVSVKRTDILIGTVQTGDLDVIIEGYGTLTSDKQQLITALTRATVKEIVLKPGAKVSAQSIIIKMENPELLQQVENAQQGLAQIKANLRQLKVNQKRETLNERANLAEIKARYETAKLRRTAEETLVEKGIVSQLDFKGSLLDEKQLNERISLLSERAEQLFEVHKEAINIQKERIKQQKGQLGIAQERLDKLTVRAGFEGVLQRLSVELGQSLAAGQEIALIGSVTDLIALIRVPQSQAQQIQVGQRTIIDTRRDKIEGIVARIDPIVENNTVNIEISLPNKLPASARPQQNVDGVIIAETLKNINFIERPANVKSFSTGQLYRLNNEQQTATLSEIKYGQQAGQFIQILSGAKSKDKFIVSDLSNLKSTNSELEIKY